MFVVFHIDDLNTIASHETVVQPFQQTLRLHASAAAVPMAAHCSFMPC